MARRPPTPRKKCIFCGEQGTKITREHVWADWLKSYIPKTDLKHTALSGILEQDGRMEYTIRTWGGDARSRRLPIVCLKCNTGWMGKLQENAKYILIPLITGDVKILNQIEQSVLATWSTMAVMVAEYFEPRSVTFTAAERRYLMDRHHPPANVRIWMGRYIPGEWNGLWVHRSIRIADEFVPSTVDPSLPLPNTQTATFVVGELYLHVVSCEDDLILRKLDLPVQAVTLFAPIWPVTQQAIVWPMNAMSDIQAVRFSTAIADLIDYILRMAGG